MKTLESRTAIWRLWKINTNRQTVEGKQNLKNNQFVGQPIPVMQVLLFFMSPNSQPELKGNPNPGTAEQEWKERCETSLLYLVKQYEWRGWGQLHVGLRENPVLFFFFFLFTFFFQLCPWRKPISLLATVIEGILKSLREGNLLDQKNKSIRIMRELKGETDKSTLIIWDFNIPLLIPERMNRKKIIKGREDLNNTWPDWCLWNLSDQKSIIHILLKCKLNIR